jgi:hypothetical protein
MDDKYNVDELMKLHLNDLDDTEIYNDAAVRQAQQDFLDSNEMQEEEIKPSRRYLRFNNDDLPNNSFRQRDNEDW